MGRKEKPPPPASRAPYLLVASACLALYARVLSFGYVYLDDNALILGNAPFLMSWGSVLGAFRQDVFHILHGTTAYYRPLFMASLVMDAHVSGLAPWGYHLTSILIHIGASCLFLKLLRRLGYAEGLCLAFSLAFAVSPVLVQAVALIPDRDDSMLGLCALGAFLSFMRWRETGRGLWVHALWFALALFCKETGAVLVPALALAWPLLFEDWKWSAEKGKALAVWAGALAVWYALRRAALPNPIHVGPAEALASIWAGLPSIVQAVGKILLPFDLSVLPYIKDTPMVWGWIGLALLAGGLALSKPRWNRVAFGAAWFLLFLLPSMTLHATTFADVAMEKRLYVPLIGFILILMETRWPRGAVFVLAVYAALAWRHSGHFKDRMAFWTNAVETSPHLPLAHRNLGAMYYLDKNLDKAGAEFRAAAALNPAEPMVHNNLGLVYMGLGMDKEAESEYLKELALNPSYDNALFNLGLLRYKQGRVAETEALWKKTLEVNPDYGDAYRNLAVLLLKRGERAQAQALLDEGRRRGLFAP